MTYKYVIKRNADSVVVLGVSAVGDATLVAEAYDDKRLADWAVAFFRELARVGGHGVMYSDESIQEDV